MSGNKGMRAAYVRAEIDAEFLDCSAGQLLRDAVRQVGDRAALIVPSADGGQSEQRWTYRELEAEAERAAGALLSRFKPGDHLATWAAGSADIVVLQLGASLAGIVLVTLNPANRADELHYMLAQSRARGLFLDRSFRGLDNGAVLEGLRDRLPDLETVVYLDEWDSFVANRKEVKLPDVSPESSALILFTSGSTGKPKAAVLRHAGIVNNAALAARHLQVAPGTVWLNVLPMFHVGGSVTMTLGCIASLGTQVLLPQFSPEAMLDAIERYQVGLTMAVPTMLIGLLESPRLAETDLSAFELIVAGGSAVAPELVRRVKREMGADVASLMGQTEASGTIFATRPGDGEDRITGSVGTPIALSEAKVVSTADGRTNSIGDIGEICVRSRCVMQEYFGMPEKTRETLDADGWLHTGDLGYMREDGYVQITGRLKEMIIRGGENIYPREIEDALVEHPDIAQAAVFGVPDEKWGEQVAAAVIPRPGCSPDPEGLTQYLQGRIARYKVPKFWRVVDSFPLNATGKIQKFVLQEEFSREGGK